VKLAARRPAETGGIAGAVALIIAAALGLDDATLIAAIGVVIGFLPAGITWLVEIIRHEAPGPPLGP
jgi:hypothetical protein